MSYFILALAILILLKLLASITTKLKKRKEIKWIKENSPYHKFTDSSYIEYLHKNHTTVYGIYVIRNRQNGLIYVGQSVNVINRVHNHMNKRGNKLIARDLSKGHTFEVMIIPLADTNYNSLNELEKAYIAKYNSYYKGYNKTRGNN